MAFTEELVNIYTSQWRHNGLDSVSNQQPHDCLLKRLFKHRSKKTSKLCVTGLCAGNSPETVEFPAQRASNAENFSIWWRHHDPILFANDTNLTNSLCSFNEGQSSPDRIASLSQAINNKLKEIQNWLKKNTLSLNVKKPKYMILHNRQWDRTNHIPKLELNGDL